MMCPIQEAKVDQLAYANQFLISAVPFRPLSIYLQKIFCQSLKLTSPGMINYHPYSVTKLNFYGIQYLDFIRDGQK
jgi:hypothetical protein